MPGIVTVESRLSMMLRSEGSSHMSTDSSESLDSSPDDLVYFELLDQRYVALIKQYSNQYSELYKDIEAKTFRREYAKGGEQIHRGYYSPTMLDLVDPNYKRGQLLKRPNKNSRYNYEYLFDTQDNLICVHAFINDGQIRLLTDTELLIYETDSVIGLFYNTPQSFFRPLLYSVSECRYADNQLIEYVKADLFLGQETIQCITVDVEEPEYIDNQLQELRYYRYYPALNSLETHRYVFQRDAEDNLSTFTHEKSGGPYPAGFQPDESDVTRVSKVLGVCKGNI